MSHAAHIGTETSCTCLAANAHSTESVPHDSPATPAKPPVKPQVMQRKTHTLAQLLGGAQSIDIDHNGHVYRLQVTKAGKLILTK